MTGNTMLIIALVLLMTLSGFFSFCETSFTSINRVKLRNLMEQGNKRAARVYEMSRNFDKVLSTILIGNNMVNIVSASLATVLFVSIFGSAGVTISAVFMTIFVLLFVEISPKTLAKAAPEKSAMSAVSLLHFMTVILAPVNWLMLKWQKLVLRLFKPGNEQGVTQQELLTFVEEVRQGGGINEKEEEMIRTVIEFDDLVVGDIYIPRVDIYAIAADENLTKVDELFIETKFSRLPVYRENIDQIEGILLEKDFHCEVEDLGRSIQNVLKPVIFVPKDMKLSVLLQKLQQEKLHMAVVADEYGGTLGILTIEDIVEEIVGEIWDEYDEIREDISMYHEGAYIVNGGISLEKLYSRFELNETAPVQTVGGWVIEQLKKIPAVDDRFSYKGLEVTVFKMRRNRVEEVLVRKQGGTGGA